MARFTWRIQLSRFTTLCCKTLSKFRGYHQWKSNYLMKKMWKTRLTRSNWLTIIKRLRWMESSSLHLDRVMFLAPPCSWSRLTVSRSCRQAITAEKRIESWSQPNLPIVKWTFSLLRAHTVQLISQRRHKERRISQKLSLTLSHVAVSVLCLSSLLARPKSFFWSWTSAGTSILNSQTFRSTIKVI